jgi:hypothetical protein
LALYQYGKSQNVCFLGKWVEKIVQGISDWENGLKKSLGNGCAVVLTTPILV